MNGNCRHIMPIPKPLPLPKDMNFSNPRKCVMAKWSKKSISNICTPYELAFLKSVGYNYSSQNNVVISSLYQYGLFVQKSDDEDVIKYVLSDFAKALKQNCLNFDDGVGSAPRLLSYSQIAPLDIMEPITFGDFERITQDKTLVLNGGSSTENID